MDRNSRALRCIEVVRIALGQINATVGDIDGNVERMAEWASRAADSAADLICFPELAVTGYPPEDLVLRPEFVRDNLEGLDELARRTAGGCAVLTGFIDRSDRGLHNAAGVLSRCGDRKRAWLVFLERAQHTRPRGGEEVLRGGL